MHNHYIINGAVEFHPATSTLRDLNHPDNVVVLNSPAGRCLLLLIERTGSIVTQREFIEIVWENRGMHVSGSTFYQNISILRKGLKKIGLHEEIVVTLPRIGLTLSSGTHINKLATEQQVEVNHENAHYIDERSIAHEHKTVNQSEWAEEADLLTLADPAKPYSEKTTYQPETPSKRFSQRSWIIGSIGVVASIALLGAAAVTHHFRSNSEYFSHYQLINTSRGCHIFISESLVTNVKRATALNHVNQFYDQCKSYPWLYVTHFPLLPRTSFIRCDKPMNEQNTCISDYFFEDR